MRSAEQNRPRIRRLGNTLGAFYTSLAALIALVAWGVSGQSSRLLAVLVVATPCPLLIAIPVAIIGAISLCARRGIIVKNPVVLETIETCRTALRPLWHPTCTFSTALVPLPGSQGNPDFGGRKCCAFSPVVRF